MASTETNIRRDSSFSVLKFVFDGATTQTGIVSLKGVKNAWLVCDTGGAQIYSQAYLPSVDGTGAMTVPVANLAYAEVTGIDTVGGGADAERQGVPCVGTNSNPLFIPQHAMPPYVYFTMPATSTGYLYLAY